MADGCGKIGTVRHFSRPIRKPKNTERRSKALRCIRACAAFREHESSLHLYAFPELRLRIRPGRVIIPDVSVFHPTHPTEPVPATTPFIVIEIISPDDRISEVRKKLQEYVDWGVPHVWLIDPRLRRLYLCTDGLHEVPTYSIPELNLTIPPAKLFR